MKKKSSDAPKAPAIDAELKFKVAESYKTIRTNMMFSIIKSGCKTIVISSSQPNEGKSTGTVNIAISLAQANFKVLLIDTDLRKPKVHRFLDISNTPGLTNYLGGMNKITDVLHTTQYANLNVICAGVLVPNPSEILASEHMSDLLKSLEAQYDYILLDSTPLNVVSDALPLIKNSDGVILMVRDGLSTYTELTKTVRKLEMIDAKILGLVLNGVKADKKGRYKNGYGYGYGYGY